MNGKIIEVTGGYTQEATCGLQVCQHPLCWATNRQAARGLLRPKLDRNGNDINRDPEAQVNDAKSENEDDDIWEGLPTVTILNLLDEYGEDSGDRYPSPSVSEVMERQNQKFKAQDSRNIPPEGTNVVPKLTIKALASHSTDDVTAPANTPLHSFHGFGDYQEYRSPLGHSKYGSHKPAFTETTVSMPGSERGVLRTKYHKVQMELEAGDAAGLKPKRLLVWCPASKGKRRKQSLQVHRPRVPPSLKAVSLPLTTVPEYRSKQFSHKAIRATMPKKTAKLSYKTRKAERSAKVDKSTLTTAMPPHSRATPQEIAQLRNVPVDILIRVLNQAEEKGVITSKQTSILLQQVTGQKEKLPSIQETKQHTEERGKAEVEEIVPTTPLETKNLKILGAEDRSRSPRLVMAEPVYKLDTSTEPKRTVASRGNLPAATEIHYAEKPVTPIVIPKVLEQSEQEVAKSETRKEDDSDKQYNEKLREAATENLRNIGALSKEVPPSPKKTPVRYIATVFDEEVPPTPPIKPFHYPRSPREMFLGPIPSPPPPTPPTERDSSYDEQAGGSTMLVNPSLTGPPTITSYGDKVPSSPSGTKTPTTGRDIDSRPIKMTQSGAKNGTQRRKHMVASPFGSSTGEGWPQINEEDFLLVGGSSELPASPMQSFTEDEIRVLSRNESAASVRGETPMAEKFQNFQRGEIHSPAPPPPSPEPMAASERQHKEDKIPTSPRVGGAATALGLVALGKDSSHTSPETGGGLTPTPVVSSVTSGVETPLGRVTRMNRLNSTPAIAETPNENEDQDSTLEKESPSGSENHLKGSSKNLDAQPLSEKLEEGKQKEPTDQSDDFEKNVSPEVAKEELELEIKKLDIS